MINKVARRKKSSKNREAEPEPSETGAGGLQTDKRAEFLTAKQLARMLQISESTVHRLRRSGRIPAVVLTGRLIRFNLKDVKNALRPAHAARAVTGSDREASPQLAFDDLYAEFTN